MKKIFSIIPAALLIIACNAQEKKDRTVHSEKKKPGNPSVDVKVNKKYDSSGNLVKYDSTYSYFYSSRGRDSMKVGTDSVFREFKKLYSDVFPDKMNREMSDIFMNDSLFKYDFLNDDYFRKRFELNAQRMDQMFLEMDSLKNRFLKENKEAPKKMSKR